MDMVARLTSISADNMVTPFTKVRLPLFRWLLPLSAGDCSSIVDVRSGTCAHEKSKLNSKSSVRHQRDELP